jgi:hypothetical protein
MAAFRTDFDRAPDTYLVLQFSIGLDNGRKDVPATFNRELLDDVDTMGRAVCECLRTDETRDLRALRSAGKGRGYR